jgi:hypothetical protein
VSYQAVVLDDAEEDIFSMGAGICRFYWKGALFDKHHVVAMDDLVELLMSEL